MAGFGWFLDARKFLVGEEVTRLRRLAAQRRRAGGGDKGFQPIRDWFLLETALATGLRLMELAALRCGDLLLEHGRSLVLVRKGKGGKSRVVKASRRFALYAKWYLRRKTEANEATDEHAPLFTALGGVRPLGRRRVQKIFERLCADAGLSRRYGIHALRHTYATRLYKAGNGNLRLVQKQLGHARITTTQIYADVMDEDAQAAVERLFKR